MDHLVTTWRKFVDTADDGVQAHAVFHRPDPDCPCELLLTRDTEQVGGPPNIQPHQPVPCVLQANRPWLPLQSAVELA